ncbi:SUMF1/EgtB/PvdO family nonheme iron enzyme [Pendulispora albinea]|uniref:SUMF1/EgtB/PvdO family nonheme iron enzyme n=2 Tax=Pendulispora albinea TaxID=2741071 RepID=A0ABZ2MCM2_9BACT
MNLGRSVALKLLHSDRLEAPGTTRLVDEARAIAPLNHPHIVQVYDVGEHVDALFLALEYVDGETLKERADRERIGVDEVLRVARAIADALAHAHAAGVIHCDLKPSNVMLGKDGRLRVVDFGLAHTETGRQRRGGGTPNWMAPEQWRGGVPSDRIDIWALGAIAAHLLTGAHPHGDVEVRGHVAAGGVPSIERSRLEPLVPPPLIDLIVRSLDPQPQNRPSARAWFNALDEILDNREPAQPNDGPYRGLAAFNEEHARFFFGREQEIEAFLERLREVPCLPIVGPSGAGKTSFLHAGIVPRLHARERWTVIGMRPGARPIETLAHHVLAATSPAESSQHVDEPVAIFAAALRQTPTLLAARLMTIAFARGTKVLLAIDQLEELRTNGAPEEDIHCFLGILLNAADDPREPVRIIFAIRDDFLSVVPGVRSLFVPRRLGAIELRRIIVGPLRSIDYRFDDESVVDDMLAEFSDDEAAALPLLQFACRALWDARDEKRRLLLRSAYERMGGVAGALAKHAAGAVSELTASEQRIARQLLVRLVVGTARRAVERDRLLAGLPEPAGLVVDRLLAARLLVQQSPQAGAPSVVEIAHESLLRTWEQLSRWLDESHEERRSLAELDEAARFWERRGRRDEETWSDADLAAARERIARFDLAIPSHVAGFLSAGENYRARLRHQRRNRNISVATLALTITVGSLTLAAAYRQQKMAAERQAEDLRLAGRDFGQFELVLTPFDKADHLQRAIDAVALPALSWRLYGQQQGDPHKPGAPIPGDLVRVVSVARGRTRIDRVDAPGGLAFLRVDGRGRAGETCAPSWIRLQSLPGYASRRGPISKIEIAIPTCQASAEGMITIGAGAFVYGGPGEPATHFPDYVEPEQVVELGEYGIDRAEVSNADFEPFAKLQAITGYAVPTYPAEPAVAHAGAGPDMPVTAIDAFEAEAFCRYMGKRLPSDFEWTKAARGGMTIDGKLNPWPRRLYPWGPQVRPRCANVDGTADGFRWVAPAGASTCDESPYGVLNLAGNVAEWISREGQTDKDANPNRTIRAGQVDSPPELEHATTVFRNTREARQFSFALGVRCASGGRVE